MTHFDSPNIETKTGDVFRLSASGNVIDTVKTDPRLVPNHSVGMSVDGSKMFFIFIQMTKKEKQHETRDEQRPEFSQTVFGWVVEKGDKLPFQLTALLCITINKR